MSELTSGARAEEDRVALLSELESLSTADLRARWQQQPARHVLQFGEGMPNQQTVRGNPEDAYHGVIVYNPTGKALTVGFNASAAVGGPFTVPPASVTTWPAQFANLSLAVNETDGNGPVEQLFVVLLRYPPDLAIVETLPVVAASATRTQPEDITVKLVSVPVIGANPARKGLEIVNTGAEIVRLALGQAAKANAGLYLVKQGGSWNGELSAALWRGTVNAICPASETTLGVIEV